MASHPLLVIAPTLFVVLLALLFGLFVSIPENEIGTLHRRSYFYIGGSYSVHENSTIASGQVYVEHLVPANITQPLPLLFIHGLGMTGTNFLTAPDGRIGWADYFLGQGYEVYIVDQPSRGRSSWQKTTDGTQDILDTYFIESRFTATRKYKLWPQASLHTQWPGTGVAGDPIFDNFYASIMPSLRSDIESSQKMKTAGSLLLDKIGPVILITHSQSGQLGWIIADARPSKIKAIVALEPRGPPFEDVVFTHTSARPFGLTEIPLTFSPPVLSAADFRPTAVTDSITNLTCVLQSSPPRRMTNLANIPVLVVTSESGYHVVYDHCSVRFLRQAGVPVDHVYLAEVGIRGNGHMMFMEKNGLQIADRVVQRWITTQRL